MVDIAAAAAEGLAAAGAAGAAAGAATAVVEAGTIAATAAEVSAGVAAGGTAAEVATITPNAVAAGEVSSLADAAAASADIAAGEHAIGDLANLPDGLGSPALAGETPELKKIDQPLTTAEPTSEFTGSQEANIQGQTSHTMKEWKLAHPQPANADPNSKEYKDWAEAYDKAETDFIVDTKTNIAMEDWAKQKGNEEPDPANKEAHAAWKERRDNHEQSLRKKFATETKGLKEGQRSSILRDIDRLYQLNSIRHDIKKGVDSYHKIPVLSEEEKRQLALMQNNLFMIDNEIRAIRARLQAQLPAASPLVIPLIAAALAATLLVQSAAKEGLAA